MLLTNFIFDNKSKAPRYKQLADFIKKEIHKKNLAAKVKLPSIRQLANSLKVSRTTTETAYNVLVADGFLINKPKRGYFVANVFPKFEVTPTIKASTKKLPTIKYDFANNYVDAKTFPIAVWRRHLNSIIKNKNVLSAYGEAQGELALRQTLAKYSNEARGVICTEDQIVIGAGVQSLAQILAAIFEEYFKEQPAKLQIALEAPGFPQVEETFSRHNWKIEHFSIENLTNKLPKVLYVSPSNPYKGRSLLPKNRLDLLHWAKEQNAFILEDDYNGEFRYFSRPISALQGMSDGENIIYLGSFSRILLPSLRISYMVLPPKLLEIYQKIKPKYNQTSSTMEQLTLAAFINEGNLRRHVKKLRKLYSEKNTLLRKYLQKYFQNKVEILAYESGLHLRLAVKTNLSSQQLAKKALEYSVQVRPIANSSEVLLSFAGIDEKDIEPAVKELKKAWFK